MELIWSQNAPDNYGYKLALYQSGEQVGELLVWNNEDNGIRVNWMMVKKKMQNKGYGKIMLEEVKRNVKNYFPNAEVLFFQDVTSIGMLQLIENIFGDVEWYINENLSETYRENRMKQGIDLPEQSPAKYNSDGSCRIAKSAKKETFKVKL